MHRCRFLAMGCPQAIRARIAAADDHDAFARGENLVCDSVARAATVLLRQEIHREMDTLQFASGDREIARLLGSACQQNGVEILA